MINKYKQVLADCKELEKGLSGDQWTLGLAKGFSMEIFWTWSKVNPTKRSGDLFIISERCASFEK